MKSHVFGRSALLGATSLMAIAAAAPVCAQTAAPAPAGAPDTMNTIVVTGFRASLQSALQEKRRSNLPIESVAPEDIGKMPDTNVAESLQRLPGVQIDRSDGYGTAVLIDGLRYNLTTLNGDTFLTGKEFYVSGENSGGGSGGGVQYNSLEGIPSEEIGGIDVYKNPQGSITEGGLGGTIDLKTRDPLSAPQGLTLGGNVRESNATGAKNYTPSATLVGTYKVDSNLAFTGSVSYEEQDIHDKEYQAANRGDWLYTNDQTATVPTAGPETPGDISTMSSYYLLPGFGYFTDQYIQRKDLGASLGVTYKLGDGWKTSLLWFYSHEDEQTLSYSFKTDFNASQSTTPSNSVAGLASADAYSIGSNGVLNSGSLVATGAEAASDYYHDLSQANNFQWNTSYDNGGPFRAKIDLSYSRATNNFEADQADVEHGLYNSDLPNANGVGNVIAGNGPGCNNQGASCTTGNAPYVFTYNSGGTNGLPSVSIPTGVLTNAADTLYKSNWAWAQASVETEWSAKADAAYDLPAIWGASGTLEAGARFAERNVNAIFGKYLENDPTLASTATTQNNLYYLDPGYVVIPYSTGATTPSLNLTTNIFGIGSVIVKNPVTGGMENPATYLNTVWNNAPACSASNGTATYPCANPNNSEKFYKDTLSSFVVDEKTTAGYVMTDFGQKGDRYHLNLGVRVVQTNITIDGAQQAASPTFYGSASWNGVNSNNVPVQTTRSYTDVLPSINFSYDLTDSQKIRFGAARVVSPADLYNLGKGNSYNFTRIQNDPAHVNKTTGLEDGFGFVSGSSGNADLNPYRANQENASWEDYFAKGALVSVAVFAKQIDSFEENVAVPTFVNDDFGGDTGIVNKPINAGAGSIYGLELSGQYAFDDSLSPWLQGFGVAANYTYSNSTSDQTTALTNHLAIPGVSKNSVTAEGYYERGGFSARLSWTWRDQAVYDGGLTGSTFQVVNSAGKQETLAVFSAPYGQLDGQVGYDFNKHFGITFSVQNIANEAQHAYMQWPDEPITYDDAGTRYFLGIKFKN